MKLFIVLSAQDVVSKSSKNWDLGGVSNSGENWIQYLKHGLLISIVVKFRECSSWITAFGVGFNPKKVGIFQIVLLTNVFKKHRAVAVDIRCDGNLTVGQPFRCDIAACSANVYGHSSGFLAVHET